MKASGMIRRVDQLGRVVIPREILDSLNIKRREPGVNDGEPLEIFVDGGQIVLKKYNPGCFRCGSLEDLHMVFDIKVCGECAKEIAKVVK